MWFDNNDPRLLESLSEVISVPEVEVVSHRIYQHPSELIYLVGEIRNKSEYNINVEINAYLFEKDKVKGFGWSSTLIPIIVPEQKTPFRVLFHDIKGRFDKYSLKTKFGIIKQDPFREFKILEHNHYKSESGNFIVEGKVKNIGLCDISIVKAIGTFYEVNGIILAFDTKSTNPENLKVNEEGEFKLTVPSKLLSSMVKYYSLDFWTPTGLNLVSIKW